MDAIELIQWIERRPGMFITSDSLESLDAFVRGFCFARSQDGVLDPRDALFGEGFYPWLKERYCMDGGPSWAALVEALAAKRREPPLAVFFAELHVFLEATTVQTSDD